MINVNLKSVVIAVNNSESLDMFLLSIHPKPSSMIMKSLEAGVMEVSASLREIEIMNFWNPEADAIGIE